MQIGFEGFGARGCKGVRGKGAADGVSEAGPRKRAGRVREKEREFLEYAGFGKTFAKLRNIPLIP